MNKEEIGAEILVYCKKYHIPTDYLLEILEDQKVIPMIRGKALEYNGYLRLKDELPSRVWDVQKLNLNAQTGHGDEDISITHRRSGVILKVECKSAVRGSFNTGKRARIHKVPHFKVKSHRSRSNISKAETSNDRYAVDEFDVLLTTPENGIYEGGTVGENLELIHNDAAQKSLMDHYGVTDAKGIVSATNDDWRFCIPSDIAEDGFIPRTPYVLMKDDLNWKPLSKLSKRLELVVNSKLQLGNSTGRR